LSSRQKLYWGWAVDLGFGYYYILAGDGNPAETLSEHIGDGFPIEVGGAVKNSNFSIVVYNLGLVFEL